MRIEARYYDGAELAGGSYAFEVGGDPVVGDLVIAPGIMGDQLAEVVRLMTEYGGPVKQATPLTEGEALMKRLRLRPLVVIQVVPVWLQLERLRARIMEIKADYPDDPELLEPLEERVAELEA